MPFREAHAVVGALVREVVDGDRSLAELVAAEPRLGAEGVALLAPGACGRAPDDARARVGPSRSARSSRPCGRSSTARRSGSPDARVLRPRPARARAGPAQQGARLHRGRRPALAARIVEVEAYCGVGRPGEPRVPRAHRAQRDDVRASGPALRVLRVRDALVRQRRRRRRRRTTPARCCCAPRRRWPGSTSCGPAGRRHAATASSAPARPGSRRRSASIGPTTASTWCAGRSASTTTAPRRRRGPGARSRVGLRPGRGDRDRWRWFVPGVAEVSGPDAGAGRVGGHDLPRLPTRVPHVLRGPRARQLPRLLDRPPRPVRDRGAGPDAGAPRDPRRAVGTVPPLPARTATCGSRRTSRRTRPRSVRWARASGPRTSTCRSRPRGCSSASGLLPPGPRSAGALPRRGRRHAARRPAREARARGRGAPGSTCTSAIRSRPHHAATRRTIRASSCSAARGSPPGTEFPIRKWLHTAAVRERVVQTWSAARPLYGWLERHVGPSTAPPPEPD